MSLKRFAITLVPVTMSSLIRDMHRHEKQFNAINKREAQRLINEAFPYGLDTSGSWAVEALREVGVAS